MRSPTKGPGMEDMCWLLFYMYLTWLCFHYYLYTHIHKENKPSFHNIGQTRGAILFFFLKQGGLKDSRKPRPHQQHWGQLPQINIHQRSKLKASIFNTAPIIALDRHMQKYGHRKILKHKHRKSLVREGETFIPNMDIVCNHKWRLDTREWWLYYCVHTNMQLWGIAR